MISFRELEAVVQKCHIFVVFLGNIAVFYANIMVAVMEKVKIRVL